MQEQMPYNTTSPADQVRGGQAIGELPPVQGPRMRTPGEEAFDLGVIGAPEQADESEQQVAKQIGHPAVRQSIEVGAHREGEEVPAPPPVNEYANEHVIARVPQPPEAPWPQFLQDVAGHTEQVPRAVIGEQPEKSPIPAPRQHEEKLVGSGRRWSVAVTTDKNIPAGRDVLFVLKKAYSTVTSVRRTVLPVKRRTLRVL